MSNASVTKKAPTPVAQPGGSKEFAAPEKPFGPAAAAFLAAGITSAFFGILTTFVEGSKDLQTAITYSTPVGPLSGKVFWSVGVYMVALAVLGVVLWRRNPSQRLVYITSGALFAVGVIFTYPPTWKLFGA